MDQASQASHAYKVAVKKVIKSGLGTPEKNVTVKRLKKTADSAIKKADTFGKKHIYGK